jgi:hypothetical protein
MDGIAEKYEAETGRVIVFYVHFYIFCAKVTEHLATFFFEKLEDIKYVGQPDVDVKFHFDRTVSVF